MATELVTDYVQSPTFMWVYHSFNGLVSRFRPTKLFGLLLSDTLTDTLPIKGGEYATGILDLPEELLVYVLQFLNHKDLGRCERVCKEWKTLIDNRPAFWEQVDIEKCLTKSPSIYSRISLHDRLVSYVNHLVGQGARIECLKINLDQYDEETYNVIAFLVSSGCCAHLQQISIRWTEDCSYGDTTEFDTSYIFYLSTLELLENFSSELSGIRTQFNWTFDSVNYLTKFRNIAELDVLCVPRVHTIQKWHVEKVLKQLPNLQVFRLRVTIMPDLVQKFNLVSKTLRILDISNCVNFLINSTDLPSLQRLEARSMLCHRRVCTIHKSFCFYDVLQNGCPAIKEINGWKADKSEAVFGIPFVNQCSMKLCFCPRHVKMPAAIAQAN